GGSGRRPGSRSTTCAAGSTNRMPAPGWSSWTTRSGGGASPTDEPDPGRSGVEVVRERSRSTQGSVTSPGPGTLAAYRSSAARLRGGGQLGDRIAVETDDVRRRHLERPTHLDHRSDLEAGGGVGVGRGGQLIVCDAERRLFGPRAQRLGRRGGGFGGRHVAR